MLTSQHIELEQSILGTMFIYPNLIAKAKENIKKYMFQIDNHSMIYEGILKMSEDKKEIDLINFLENYKEIVKEMGGVSYVTEVYSCSSTDLAFETKLELLIKAFKKMTVLNLCSYLSDEMTIEDMEDKLNKTLVKLYNCTLKKELDIEEVYDNYLKNLYESNKDMGIKSGLTKIDDALGNFRKGRLITVFARSGVGKSVFSIQVAKNMALSRYNVIYGSAEMSESEVLNRMAASEFSIDNSKFEKDTLTDEEKDKVATFCASLSNNQLYISTETNIDRFINEVKVYKLKNKLDIIFLDYINKYIDSVSSAYKLTERIGQITSRLKTFALEENICIVLVAQANRTVDKNVGEVYEILTEADIQDSARIEQDSDQIIGLYRDKRFDDRAYRDKMFREGNIDYDSKDSKENPNCINAIILKNRHGGRGIKAFRWEGMYCKISNW